MSDTPSLYEVVNDPLVKHETVQTKKSLFTALTIGEKNTGHVPKTFLNECWDGIEINKSARAKTVRMFDIAFPMVGEVYIMPCPPEEWMYEPLYTLSHRPDKEKILSLFGVKPFAKDTLIGQLHLRILELEEDNRNMARTSQVVAQAADEIKEQAEEALEQIRNKVLVHYVSFLGKVDNTLEEGFKHIIRDVNKATSSITFPRFDGKREDFGNVWDLIDKIEEATNRYTT